LPALPLGETVGHRRSGARWSRSLQSRQVWLCMSTSCTALRFRPTRWWFSAASV